MRKRVFLLCVVLLCSCASWAMAAQELVISGEPIPLMEGAELASSGSAGSALAKEATYSLNRPLSEVVIFYASFFKENNFLVIGGVKEDGFSAALKKGNAMFSLNIYSQGGRTLIEFVW